MLRVRVQPRASRDAILGWQAGTLRLRVSAPPVDGEANRAVATLLAKALGVAPSSVRVVQGERGRDKLVEITGVAEEDVRSRLASRSPAPRSEPPLGFRR